MTDKKPKYFIVIGIALFLIANLCCFYSSVRMDENLHAKEIKVKSIEGQESSIVVDLPEKDNYLIRVKGNYADSLTTNCKVFFNKQFIASFSISRKPFQKEIIVESGLTEKGKNLLNLEFERKTSKISQDAVAGTPSVENLEINTKNFRGYNKNFPRLVVFFSDSRNLFEKILIVKNMFPPVLSLLMTYLFISSICYLILIVVRPLYNIAQLKIVLISLLPAVFISVISIATDIAFSYYIVWDLFDLLLLIFIPFIIAI